MRRIRFLHHASGCIAAVVGIHCATHPGLVFSPNRYLLCSAFLMAVSASRRLETERPTAACRTNDPLRPVKPACSEPMAMIR